jgi:hypothetical protein
VCPGLTVAAEPGDLGKVEGKLILEPVDGITRAAGQNADEIVASEVACLDGLVQHILTGSLKRL